MGLLSFLSIIIFFTIFENTLQEKENDWITDVHMIFMNHLDVGYANFVNNILNQYFQKYFTRAASISNELKKKGFVENMVYTTHPWLVNLFLNCPDNFVLSGIKLMCPNQVQRDIFLEAIRNGDITWHAGPMNLQVEFAPPWLYEISLDISSNLDKLFNISRKHKVLSQRDVPGLSQGAIPILVKKGINSLTVGVNAGTPPPDVPKLFRWNFMNESILASFHPGGYPNDPGPTPVDPKGLSRNDCIFTEGFNHALCFVFRTDNAGPPENLQEVLTAYEILRAEFPNAKLKSDNLEDFFQLAYENIFERLPIIESEIGDTWIQGISSDPKKNINFLTIANTLKDCFQSGLCSHKDDRIWNSSIYLIKLVEHTWGLDSVHDTENWNNPSFDAVRKTKQSMIDSANSWWEQRNFTDMALKALGKHPVTEEIKRRIKNTIPHFPILEDFSEVNKSYIFSCPSANIKMLQFGSDGSIIKLNFNNTNLADDNHVLGNFVYKTFDEKDFNDFGTLYNYNKEWSAGFYKPNCTASAHPESKLWQTSLNNLYVSKVKECDFWLNISMADFKTVNWYGAPKEIWIRYTSRETPKQGLNVVLQWFNKTVTRLPEAISMAFKPVMNFQRNWTIYKMNRPINPYNVIKNGSQYNHVLTEEGARYGDEKFSVTFRSSDIPVVNILTGNEFCHTFPAPLTSLDKDSISGVAFNIYNNIWETNYIFWYPYLDEDDHLKCHFFIDYN